MDRLKGKTALITGAARGIGAQIARRFSEEGANVIINDLSLDAAQTMADQIGGSALACDVSDPQAVDAMFEQVGRQFENLDILVIFLAIRRMTRHFIGSSPPPKT